MMPEQLDLLDNAPREVVGMGGHRVGKSLRRLLDSGIVTMEAIEGGGIKVLATEEGRKFLSLIRAHRLSI